MRARDKKFIRERLIPFIMREKGRGFGMNIWLDDDRLPGKPITLDDVTRKVPKCGTVGCIGGSIALLKRKKDKFDCDYELTGKSIGLNDNQSGRLFSGEIRWPEPYRTKFWQAETPYQKAKIACELLREVCETSGHCLDYTEEEIY
jgi:hypothetical protein